MEGALTFKKIEYFWKTYVAKSNFNIFNFDNKELKNYPELNKVIELVKKINNKLNKDIKKNIHSSDSKKRIMFQEFQRIQQ
jgi:hypothetical protein